MWLTDHSIENAGSSSSFVTSKAHSLGMKYCARIATSAARVLPHLYGSITSTCTFVMKNQGPSMYVITKVPDISMPPRTLCTHENKIDAKDI
jgi:hypothetical protein